MGHQRLCELTKSSPNTTSPTSNPTWAEITSASAERPDRAESAQVALAGGRVRTTYHQDASLLGGAVVRIGSTVYDGSIRTQLQQLKQRLVNA
jgi:F-type H+-transporting ATPase subunit delta